MNKTATTVVNFPPPERQKKKRKQNRSAQHQQHVVPKLPPKKSLSIKYRGVIKFTIVVLLFWSARGFDRERERGGGLRPLAALPGMTINTKFVLFGTKRFTLGRDSNRR